MSAADDRGSGFQRAARLFAERCVQKEPLPPEEFLRAHEDLREWLEPMLAEGEPGEVKDAGSRLGPYRLLRVLGRGGMGVVHEARLGEGSEPVALKLLPGFLALHGSSVARFQREGEMAARLHHPGIVRVLDAGNAGDTRYLAMEFVQGAPLDLVLQVLRERPPQQLTGEDLAAAVGANLHLPTGAVAKLPEGFPGSYVGCAVDLAIQLAEALGHAHDAGVIHRDVKPSNVLVRADGSAVLTDLGLARETSGSSLTITGDFAGTLHYVSPEQAMARRVPVDQRTDLFSLGATLYELLTLQKAFDGETPQQVLGRILTKEPVPPGRLHPGLPPDLVTVLGKLLEKDPDRRYGSAAALVADLRAFLAYRPVAAQRASTLTRLVRWTRREPLRAALCGVLAVAIPSLAGGAGYVWARAGEIEAGRAHLRRGNVASLVDQAFLDHSLSDDDAAIRRFEAALQLEGGTTEAQLGLVLAVMSRDGAETALLRLETALSAQMPARIADLLRYSLKLRLQHPDAREYLARVPVPRTDVELYLNAVISRDSGTQTGTDVLEYIERAVLSGHRPQLWIHQHWASYADAAGDAASCRRCAANLLLNWPDAPMAIYAACIALRGVDPARALQLVQAALVRSPGDGLLHCAHGMVLSSRGELPAAIAAFERAAAALPSVPRIQYVLGKARFENGDHAGAAAVMRKVTELAPRLVDGWTGLGVAQRLAGQMDEAAGTLRHAAELHPANADARFQYGQVLVRKGELHDGLRELQEAVRFNPADPNKWHHLASAQFATGDDAGGEQSLRRAVAARPDSERAHAMLVAYLSRRGSRAEIRAALHAWVAARPNSLQAWLQLGSDAVDRDLPDGKRDAGAGLWAARRALQISKEQSGLAFLVLGEALAAVGQQEEAVQALQRSLACTAMALQPAERSQCEQRLRELQPAAKR